MIFRIKYNILDGWVHYKTQSGTTEQELGFTGSVINVMKLSNFKIFRAVMERGADHDPTGTTIVEFRPDQSISN